MSTVVESWVDNTWTTESVLTAARNQSGAGTGGLESAAGKASAIGGNDASGATNVYYISAAS